MCGGSAPGWRCSQHTCTSACSSVRMRWWCAGVCMCGGGTGMGWRGGTVGVCMDTGPGCMGATDNGASTCRSCMARFGTLAVRCKLEFGGFFLPLFVVFDALAPRRDHRAVRGARRGRGLARDRVETLADSDNVRSELHANTSHAPPTPHNTTLHGAENPLCCMQEKSHVPPQQHTTAWSWNVRYVACACVGALYPCMHVCKLVRSACMQSCFVVQRDSSIRLASARWEDGSRARHANYVACACVRGALYSCMPDM